MPFGAWTHAFADEIARVEPCYNTQKVDLPPVDQKERV